MSEETFMAATKDVANLVSQGKVNSARARLVNLVLAEREKERQANESQAEKQVDELASFIMREWPGEPSQDEGAVKTAIRVMHASLVSAAEPSASEAITLFMGWLTCRDKVSGPFSSRHHAGEAAELVAEYYNGQGWAKPRHDSDAWGKMEVKRLA